jgi:hypothetical protein
MFTGNMIDLLAPFQGFAPWVEASTLKFQIFAVANAAFCIALAALVLWSIRRWFRGNTKHNVVLVAAIVNLLATVVFGRTFASAAFEERFVFPALMILCAWMASEWRMPAHLENALMAAAVLLLVVRGIYRQRTVLPVSHALSEDLASLNSARSPDEFAERCANTTSRSWTATGRTAISHFLPNNAVAVRFMYYDCIKSGAAVPIWPSGIFRYAGTGSYDDQCSWTQGLN